MKKISLAFAALIFTLSSYAQTPDSAAIRRIGDYGKLWYILCLFHPEMAYGKTDEDSLFTNHVNDLLANPSAANFKQAVQGMLSDLHDPNTNISGVDQLSNDSVALGNRPFIKWLPDSLALFYFDPAFMAANNVRENFAGYIKLLDTLKRARSIIIDLRSSAKVTDEPRMYYEPKFVKSLVSAFADRDVSYPATRSRIHYGHEDDYANVPYYFKGWLLQNGQRIGNNPTAIQKPVCLLINRFDNYLSSEIISFQKEGLAHIVAEDSLGNFETSSPYQIVLADSVTVNLRLSETIYQDGSKQFKPDTLVHRSASGSEDALLASALQQLQKPPHKVTADDAVQNLFVSNRVNAYDSLSYPSSALRLLGLARYWSIINYFCPNKDRITKKWDDVLYQYVPLFFNARDSFSYNMAAARLIKEINDGHGYFYGRVMEPFQAGSLDINISNVEGKTIIYKLHNDSLKKLMNIGDEIISINGTPVSKMRDSIAQYIGASNNAALQRDVSGLLLAGKVDSAITIGYRHNGKLVSTTLKRKPFIYNSQRPDTSVVFKKMTDKVGYADFGRLEVSQLDSMFTLFHDVDAFILDDRSYPRGTVWSMINYLTNKPVTGAIGTTMIADSPDTSTITKQDQLWTIPVHPKPQLYKGRIIILVNEETQSQAEYSCMVLQAASKNVTIVGSQTAGADGDVTGIKFPGGIYTSFSGHGIHYPDGRPTQGIGIVPDIKIKPTIAGIKAGRDEVLERAVLFAKTGK